MNDNLWFKAKRFGLGWYPATLLGWMILCAFFAALILSSFLPLPHFITIAIALALLLIWICLMKGEKPRG